MFMSSRSLITVLLLAAVPLGFLVSCAEMQSARNMGVETGAPAVAGTEVSAPPSAAAVASPEDSQLATETAVQDLPAITDLAAVPAPRPDVMRMGPSGIHDSHDRETSVNVLCEQIGNKLTSVSNEDCMQQSFTIGGGFSVNQRPLIFKEHMSSQPDFGDFRVLVMGGIHGDEYSSISILFKWLSLFSPQALEGNIHWRFAPLVNPDGLLDDTQAKRQNANGVDLNRNFPSRDWNDTAARYWQESTGSNPRRFPGSGPGSEPEVQWVVQQIEEFQPDVIVSVHAPYHLLDFDGPAVAPNKIGELYLHQLGIYPGSLGNFAGLNRQIPVVTLELPSAGIMPPAEQIDLMWKDLVIWIDREGRKGLSRL